ncbi:uncharacterized protein SPSK_00228 [Sporothrix schenckii 1099-18]|uniref:Uncharacterized protein n=1 Tax=Sporothrix schenckii 1099-18 TaxID=1397361 RepID=A0A0F2M4H9_SPOSC|nr:uncharacterized protein SPSK_00228 [Sporothrix schenckii 1099-18]KJR83989.1 hypothetical protein SPSK_00228 [Sporothrix schenckii 1099-18]
MCQQSKLWLEANSCVFYGCFLFYIFVCDPHICLLWPHQADGDSWLFRVHAQADDADGIPRRVVVVGVAVLVTLLVALVALVVLVVTLVVVLYKRPSFLAHGLAQVDGSGLAVAVVQQIVAVVGVEFAVGKAGLGKGHWLGAGVDVGESLAVLVLVLVFLVVLFRLLHGHVVHLFLAPQSKLFSRRHPRHARRAQPRQLGLVPRFARPHPRHFARASVFQPLVFVDDIASLGVRRIVLLSDLPQLGRVCLGRHAHDGRLCQPAPVPSGRDVRAHRVPPSGGQDDLAADGPRLLGVGRVRAGQDRAVGRLQDKVQRERVLPAQAAVVAVVELGQDDHHEPGRLDVDSKVRVRVAGDPADTQRRPQRRRRRPRVVQQARAVQVAKRRQHVLKGHPEHAVVTKRVAQCLEPVRRPLLGAVRPGPVPGTHVRGFVAVAPGVADLDEADRRGAVLQGGLDRPQHRVAVVDGKAVVVGPDASTAHDRQAKHKVAVAPAAVVAHLACLARQLPPQPVLVQHAARWYCRADAARQVLHALAAPAARQRAVVAVRFGKRLLQQRQPRLVGVGASRKRQRLRPALEPLPVVARALARRVVRLGAEVRVVHVQLVVDHHRRPRAVAHKHKAVDAAPLVAGHAHAAHQVRAVRHRCHGGNPPAVAHAALLHVGRREAAVLAALAGVLTPFASVLDKHWLLKDPVHAMHRRRCVQWMQRILFPAVRRAPPHQAAQTVLVGVVLQVELGEVVGVGEGSVGVDGADTAAHDETDEVEEVDEEDEAAGVLTPATPATVAAVHPTTSWAGCRPHCSYSRRGNIDVILPGFRAWKADQKSEMPFCGDSCRFVLLRIAVVVNLVAMSADVDEGVLVGVSERVAPTV